MWFFVLVDGSTYICFNRNM